VSTSSISLTPPWRQRKIGFTATESREPFGTFTLNQRVQCALQKRTGLLGAIKRLGTRHQGVIESDGRTHGLQHQDFHQFMRFLTPAQF
jgi:hypothetical protein